MKQWLLNALVAMLGILAVLSGGTTLYFFFLCALSIRLGAYALIRYHHKHMLVLYYASDTVIQAGDYIKIDYKVSNTGYLPIFHSKISFKLDEKMHSKTGLSELAFFSGQETLPFTKEMACSYRGFYRVGQVAVTIYDPLMLEKRDIFFDKEVDITVYPRVYPLDTCAYQPKELFGTRKSSKRTLYDRTNLVNIRKYDVGDSLKDIHWKLSAKRNEWYTKEYQETISQKLVIIMDGSKEHFVDRDLEEEMVSFCASFVHHVLNQQSHVKLILNDGYGTVVEGSRSTDFQAFLQALTQFESRSDIPFYDFLRDLQDKGENTVIIAQKVGARMMEHYEASCDIYTMKRIQSILEVSRE